MDDTKVLTLPPSKRFRLLQNETNPPEPLKHEFKSNSTTSPIISPSNLPTKKRKIPTNQNLPPSPTITPPTPYCLPAKKRVWAISPSKKINSPSRLPAKKRVWAVSPSKSESPNRSPAKKRVTPTKAPSCLPAKKRFWAISPTKSPIHLPAKKRIRAFRPEISPTKSPIRLTANKRVTPTKSPSCLPAKKWVWAIRPEISPTKSPICLPDKKRIRAFKPEISPTKSPLSKLDLNVEYTPSPEKNMVIENGVVTDTRDERSSGEIDDEEVDDEEDGILCAVCESTDGDPSDPIVFCDGCDLMVHSSCYGNPLINGVPEGDWFCAQCSNSRHLVKAEKNEHVGVQCCLCPVTGGALKPTIDGRWAHIVCAVLVPEVFFEDSNGRDGIDCSKVPKKRWRECCYLCKKKSGCAIECSQPKCPLSFHVTCGLKEDLCIELNEGRRNSSGGIVAAFCRKHTDIWKRQQQTGKYKIVARDE